VIDQQDPPDMGDPLLVRHATIHHGANAPK
jgi:hypothetical protein